MILHSMSLRNYRNYKSIELNTEQPLNVFIGQNAQGKTNLLEAIFMLSLTKSHRTSRDKEMIQWNEAHATLTASIQRKYGDCHLQLDLTEHGKKARINGLEQRKLSEYIGTLNVVLFAPEDLSIVKGSPVIRRRFLDMEIAQVYPSYLYALGQYNKILFQRNNFLRSGDALKAVNEGLLAVWNEQLATFGSKIMKRRQNFMQKLQVWAQSIHHEITHGAEKLVVTYVPSIESDHQEDETVLFERFMIKLSHVREQELRRGTTLVGPHRDDLLLTINDKDVYHYGSQGQQRTTALSLKLAEIELMNEETGEYPVLLLDDVLSELDRNRQSQLIETFRSKVQTFITTTSLEGIPIKSRNEMTLFHVSNGSVTIEPM
jgi:DNA replication and repair protein RecF